MNIVRSCHAETQLCPELGVEFVLTEYANVQVCLNMFADSVYCLWSLWFFLR